MSAPIPPVVNAPRRILMGPGPSDTHPRVLAALAQPTVGHLDPFFLKIMNEVQAMLREVFQMTNQLTLAVSGTGSAGMKTCVDNLVQSWYLDLSMVRNYWAESSRAYHHTAPINMNYGFHEALRIVLEEGLEARFARHLKNHLALRAGLTALGMQFAVAEEHRLPILNAVFIPQGVDDAAVRGRLLHEFGIQIGAGLGPMKGKTWRIGLMGETSHPRNVLNFLAGLENCLSMQGFSFQAGASIAAANHFYL